MWVTGHSRSLKLVPFESLGPVSYSLSIVIVAVSVAICEIFRVKKWCDLGNQVRGRSRSLKMALFDRSCNFLFVGHCKYSATLYHFFYIFDVEYNRDLEIRVRSHSRSLKIVPFKSLCVVTYSPSTWCFKNSSPLKLVGIFSFRLSLFAWNFASLLAICIHTYLPIVVDLSHYFIKWR